MPRPVRILLAILALPLSLLLYVQVAQHLLRHQAEKLHAEILALQLHPGTFTDLQRLQKEWGAHAHYDGECTPHHCIYQIVLRDVFLQSRTLLDSRYASLSFTGYTVLGGHPSRAVAGLQLRNNRMWGESFTLETMHSAGTGRNRSWPYFVGAAVDSSPRLGENGDLDSRYVRAGFRATAELNCLGCEYTGVQVTEQTPADDLRRFSNLNFSCITRFIGCKHPVDMAPDMWNAAEEQQKELSVPGDSLCTLPAAKLAQEADDILLVRVQRVEPQTSGADAHGNRVTVAVLRAVKNGVLGRIPGNLVFFVGAHSLYGSGTANELPISNQDYFFLYQHRSPYSIYLPYAVDDCLAFPDTPSLRAEVEKGITLDGSTGEPFDFRNQPNWTNPFY